MANYKPLGVAFDRTFRNDLNDNFATIDAVAADAKVKAANAETSAANAVSTANDTKLQLDNVIIESGTSDAETIQARGEFPILNDRLGAVDAQLAQNTKKNAFTYAIEEYESYATKVSEEITDWQPAILKAVSEIEDGSILEFQGKDYKVSSAILFGNKPIHIRGKGKKTRFILNNPNIDTLIKVGFDSNEGAKIPLTDDVIRGAENLNASSTTGIASGDYLMLLSDEVFSLADSNNFKGEILRVRDINGSSINFYSRVQDNYALTSGASFKKVSMVDGVTIENVSFFNPNPNTTVTKFISVNNAINVVIRNIFIKNGDNAGVTLTNVVGGVVENVFAEDMTNKQESNRYGYGIQIYRACQQVVVENCHFKRVRHGITINAMDNNYGLPRFIVIANCTGSDGAQGMFDTHPQGENITFVNCLVQGSRNLPDPNSTQYGNSVGFLIRSHKTRLVNCSVDGADDGIWLDGWARDIEIDGCKITNSKKNGIKFINNYTSQNGNVSDVRIIGGTVVRDSGETNILIDASTKNVLIANSVFINAGISVDKPSIYIAPNTEDIRVIDNNIIDSRPLPKTTYGVNFAAGASKSFALNNKVFNMKTGDIFDDAANTTNQVFRGFIASNGEFIIPNNLTGASRSSLFDISASPNKKMRLQRYSNQAVEFCFNDPTADFTVHPDGSLELHNPSMGIIMKSPNGTRFRLTVSDAGASIWTQI
ncbi:MAG: right-handed parallel beta-helix repeat-containing protein [Bacillota bacterium]